MCEIRSKCEGCGMCCRAIWIPLKHSEFNLETMKQNRDCEPIQYDEKVTKIMDDKTFIIQNWYPITKDEALSRNPQLIAWKDVFERSMFDFEEHLNNNFYGCSQLDAKNGLCRTHNNLPRVCSGYPWYGQAPNDTHQFYVEDCFYKKDVTPEALEEYDRQQQLKVEKNTIITPSETR